jgi:hypothetical protein
MANNYQILEGWDHESCRVVFACHQTRCSGRRRTCKQSVAAGSVVPGEAIEQQCAAVPQAGLM